jgi:4-azaleucine resistance transporter AzlC
MSDHSRPPARGDFRLALVDTAAIGFGLFPHGVALGLLVTQSGFAWWWVPIFSVLVYAGSVEFLLVPLLVVATPIAQIAFATLLVNSRHVFYGLSFPLHRIRGRAARAYGVYAMTDEAYALTAGRGADLSGRRITWIQVLCQFYWVLGGVVGALLGEMIPTPIKGLEFTLTALFVVLAVDAIRVLGDAITPVVAGACAVLALTFAPSHMLVVAMSLFVVVVLGRLLPAHLRPPDNA